MRAFIMYHEFKNLEEFKEYENRRRQQMEGLYWKEFIIVFLFLAGICLIGIDIAFHYMD